MENKALCFLVLKCFLHAGALMLSCKVWAQSIPVDSRTYQRYSSSSFLPHRGIFYTLYISPVLTVDPLGLQGKSTYGIALGSRFTLWESKTPTTNLTGLKINGLYTAIGYEYYPRQYDKRYVSLWLRVRTFMPLAARVDYIYATGYGLSGTNTRFGFGFEIWKTSLFFCGEQYGTFFFKTAGKHPESVSPYANVGSILLIIPILSRADHDKK